MNPNQLVLISQYFENKVLTENLQNEVDYQIEIAEESKIDLSVGEAIYETLKVHDIDPSQKLLSSNDLRILYECFIACNIAIRIYEEHEKEWGQKKTNKFTWFKIGKAKYQYNGE